MVSMQALRRVLFLAATALFLASVCFCVARLFSSTSLSLHASPHGHALVPGPGPGPKPGEPGAARRPMSYGEYGRPGFDGLTLVAALPRQLVPTADNGRRLVVVGDIHGMDSELARLLQRVAFDGARDHLVAAGDMVFKGPDSRAVVARLMSLNASAVRGNHEDRVLLALAEAETLGPSPRAERHRGVADHLAVARSLSPEHVAWLSRLPVILTADPLALCVVHAGLVPAVPLDRQDPWAVMNMRSLIYPRDKRRHQATWDDLGRRAVAPAAAAAADDDIDVAVPVDTRAGEPWAQAWDRHQQQRVPPPQRRTVIYGHDAAAGVVVGAYALGLDSGCVGGGALTAAVIEATPDGRFTRRTSQVACKPPPPTRAEPLR